MANHLEVDLDLFHIALYHGSESLENDPLSHKIKKQQPKSSPGFLNCLWEVLQKHIQLLVILPGKKTYPPNKSGFQHLTNFMCLAHFDSPRGMLCMFFLFLPVNISSIGVLTSSFLGSYLSMMGSMLVEIFAVNIFTASHFHQGNPPKKLKATDVERWLRVGFTWSPRSGTEWGLWQKQGGPCWGCLAVEMWGLEMWGHEPFEMLEWLGVIWGVENGGCFLLNQVFG